MAKHLCDNHDETIVVYDTQYGRRGDCPICYAISKMEDEIEKLSDQIDELENDE